MVLDFVRLVPLAVLSGCRHLQLAFHLLDGWTQQPTDPVASWPQPDGTEAVYETDRAVLASSPGRGGGAQRTGYDFLYPCASSMHSSMHSCNRKVHAPLCFSKSTPGSVARKHEHDLHQGEQDFCRTLRLVGKI